MKIREVTTYLEQECALSLQEGYDNSGLIVGDYDADITNVLVSLDVTEEIIEEAIQRDCNLVISHHPIVFSGLKKINGKNYVERTVIKAIKNDIALYAIHTNLDNVHWGVNAKIGETLGVKDFKILSPKSGLLKKVVLYVPVKSQEKVLEAMFAAGAGDIGEYSECSFTIDGVGTFKGSENSNPVVGQQGVRSHEQEKRLEVLVESHLVNKVMTAAIAVHPYEEVAHEIYTIENKHQNIGSGMIGELKEEMDALDLLKSIKSKFGGVVRYTSLQNKKIKKVAWCGGSGSFLLGQAKAQGADLFLSSDFKYHQFFDAENQIVIADIGHYENEQFTKQLIAELLIEKFTNFATLLTERNTNPIKYL